MATAPAVIGGTTPSHAPAERGLRPADQVSLRVLGRFELHVDGRRHEVPWQAQRVLGYLAVGGVAQPRATVAGALWEDASQRQAQANLRNAVWRVRQLSDRVLAGSRDVIALDGRVALDLRDAQRRAQALLHDDDTAADVAGINLLDDDLLPAWDEPWLLIERERQRQLRMHALEQLSASLLRAERYPQAITAALAAVRREIVNQWQSATGERVKERPTGTVTPVPSQPLRAPTPGSGNGVALSAARPAAAPAPAPTPAVAAANGQRAREVTR